MTTPVPTHPSMDAPALIDAGSQALLNNARRLGLSWTITIASVTSGDNPTFILAVCDGDTVPIVMKSMIGAIEVGTRVYVLQIPGGINYILGITGLTAPTSVPTLSYTPALFATVSPTLGTGSVTLGRWCLDPNTGWADVQIKFRFGTSGTAAGTGNYNISLPTPMDLQSDPNLDAIPGLSDTVGIFVVRDNSTTNRFEGYVYPDLPIGAAGTAGEGVGVVQLVVIGGTFVGAASPFAWAAQDAMALTIRYKPLFL